MTYQEIQENLAAVARLSEELETQYIENDGELTQELGGLLKDGRDLLDDLRETSPITTFSSVFFGIF